MVNIILTQRAHIINPEVRKVVEAIAYASRVSSYCENRGWSPQKPQKINSIKAIRTLYDLGLKEAKELYEVVMEDKDLQETCLLSLS